MKIAFNIDSIKNHQIIDDAITLHKSKIITDEQFDRIAESHESGFYSPNFIIKILLFIGAAIAISGITGLLAVMFLDALEDAYKILTLVYGFVLFVFANAVLIKDKLHFRSGTLEAVLYHSFGFFLFGVIAISEFNEHVIFISLILTTVFLAIYYLDIIATICAPLIVAYYTFYLLHIAGGIIEQLTPFILSIEFIVFFYLLNKLSKKTILEIYDTQFSITKTICLLIAYLSINYLVVREMSVQMMNLHLEKGQDIPFAFLFYFLTIIIPIIFLWYGIKHKDKLFIRLSLILIALTVLTFKYYYSSGHTEFTLTVAGTLLLGISYYLMQLLKKPKNGFTRELLLTDKWADQNLEATVISQTLGGNAIDENFKGEGGEFGGGGASGNF